MLKHEKSMLFNKNSTSMCPKNLVLCCKYLKNNQLSDINSECGWEKTLTPRIGQTIYFAYNLARFSFNRSQPDKNFKHTQIEMSSISARKARNEEYNNQTTYVLEAKRHLSHIYSRHIDLQTLSISKTFLSTFPYFI